MVLEGRSEDRTPGADWTRSPYCESYSLCSKYFFLSPSEESIPPCLLKVLRGAANNSLNHWPKKQAEKMFLQLFPSCAVSMR